MAQFQKGKPRPSKAGRKKGSLNKNTSLMAKCAERGIDVFQEMLDIAMSEAQKDKRFDKMERLAPYLYAKLRSMDLTVKSEVELQAEEFSKLPKEKQVALLESEAKRLKGEL